MSMPHESRQLLQSESDLVDWFSRIKFNGDVAASKKFLANWRHQWNKNGNRFKAGDLIFEDHKKEVLGYLKKGASIADIKSDFRISINHIKRVLHELAQEEKIYRIRNGKAFLYFNNCIPKSKSNQQVKKDKLKVTKTKLNTLKKSPLSAKKRRKRAA